MTLDEAREHIGAGVVYTFTFAGKEKREDGVITSVNDTYVFVRYTGDQISKSTYPQDLILLKNTV